MQSLAMNDTILTSLEKIIADCRISDDDSLCYETVNNNEIVISFENNPGAIFSRETARAIALCLKEMPEIETLTLNQGRSSHVETMRKATFIEYFLRE